MTERPASLPPTSPPELNPEIKQLHPAILNAMEVPLEWMSNALYTLEDRVGGRVHFDQILMPLTDEQRDRATDAVVAVLTAAENQASGEGRAGGATSNLDYRDQAVLQFIGGNLGRLFAAVHLASFYADEPDPHQALLGAVTRMNEALAPLGVKVISELTFAVVPEDFKFLDEANETP